MKPWHLLDGEVWTKEKKSRVFSVNISESQQNWRSANSYMAERKRETSEEVCEILEGQGKCAFGLKKR